VGWLFWAVLFVILLGPCIYGTWKITYGGTFPLLRIGTGAVGAAMGAGLISMAVNGVLQHRYKKQRIAERKKVKKRKQRA